MEDLERRARSIAESAVTRDNILPLLKVCAANISLSYLNQLLIFNQKPNARAVCGRKAWEHLGREIKDDAVPIQILFPRFRKEIRTDSFTKAGCRAEYVSVNVFEFGSTEGREYQAQRKKVIFADRITQITGITWELVDSEALAEALEYGMFDRERKVFCLLDNCTEEQSNRTIISLYIDYVMDMSKIDDKLLKLAVSYVVYEYLGIKHMIVRALFGRLEKMEADGKLGFLKHVLWFSKRVIGDLESNILSFNETAFINELLVTDDKDVMYLQFQQIAASLEHDELREELEYLAWRLKNSKDGYLTWLLEQKCQKTLFSYPPPFLILDETDYHKEEGGIYHVK